MRARIDLDRATIERARDERAIEVDARVREIATVTVTCGEHDRRLLRGEIIGEPRAVALHGVGAARLRAHEKDLASESELALLARVLTARMRIDALFFRELAGGGDAGRREQ